MGAKAIACPKCGYIDLARYPQGKEFLDHMLKFPAGITMYELADAFSISHSGVRSVIEKLEKAGLVVRSGYKKNRHENRRGGSKAIVYKVHPVYQFEHEPRESNDSKRKRFGRFVIARGS